MGLARDRRRRFILVLPFIRGDGGEAGEAVFDALAGVDVVDHHLGQGEPGLAGLAPEAHDLGIVDREGGDLLDHRPVDAELLTVPEVLVLDEDVGEGAQERGPHAGRARLERAPTDVEALVDDIEECTDVAREAPLLHRRLRLVERADQLVEHRRAAGAEPGVDEPGRLQ